MLWRIVMMLMSARISKNEACILLGWNLQRTVQCTYSDIIDGNIIDSEIGDSEIDDSDIIGNDIDDSNDMEIS